MFLFPNNSNIILAAEQAKGLSDKNVAVIPTKAIPREFQPYSLLMRCNPKKM